MDPFPVFGINIFGVSTQSQIFWINSYFHLKLKPQGKCRDGSVIERKRDSVS